MGAYLLEWLSLFFRWFHVIAGVAWIGASFYFVWLDLSLREGIDCIPLADVYLIMD